MKQMAGLNEKVYFITRPVAIAIVVAKSLVNRTRIEEMNSVNTGFLNLVLFKY